MEEQLTEAICPPFEYFQGPEVPLLLRQLSSLCIDLNYYNSSFMVLNLHPGFSLLQWIFKNNRQLFIPILTKIALPRRKINF